LRIVIDLYLLADLDLIWVTDTVTAFIGYRLTGLGGEIDDWAEYDRIAAGIDLTPDDRARDHLRFGKESLLLKDLNSANADRDDKDAAKEYCNSQDNSISQCDFHQALPSPRGQAIPNKPSPTVRPRRE
jgi:hypothetical protein